MTVAFAALAVAFPAPVAVTVPTLVLLTPVAVVQPDLLWLML